MVGRVSATGRGGARRKDDYYATPGWAVDAILPFLPLDGRVLEPAVGEGAIVARLVAAGVARDRVTAIELDAARAAMSGARAADFLGFAAATPERFELVVTNPPFRLAREFCDAAFRLAPTVAMLLRLNFIASKARAPWHRAHPADLYVLSRRPSFTGGGTDSTEYAWFVWGHGRGGRWRVLDAPPAVALGVVA